ncbi:MAG: outer membrane protein assembly factor BamB family protein [Acidimicrobiales bacterium]
MLGDAMAARRRFIAVLPVVASLLGAGACSGAAPSPVGAPRSRSADVAIPAASTADWVTAQHDAGRSGADPAPWPTGTVTQKWVTEPLDGDVYAQPLVVGDRVVVATGNDTVESIRASTGERLWRRRLGSPVPASELPCGNVDPVGVTGTPVVDPSSRTIYVVAMVQPAHHELFALSLDDGTVRLHRPADAPGADPRVHNQRGALSLSAGRVYIPFGGRYGDCGNYHGELVSLPARGDGPLAHFRVPSEREGGIWAPSGVAVDADGTVVLATGNSGASDVYDRGNSVLRVSADLGRLLGEFAPPDWAALNDGDADLGSVTPTLLAGDRVFQIGKAGRGYLLRGEPGPGGFGGVGGQLFDADVCPKAGAFGGTARSADLVLVPCRDALRAVKADLRSFSVRWSGPPVAAGTPIIAGGFAWFVDVGSDGSRGALWAVEPASGRPILHEPIGEVTHFASPGAGDGAVFVVGGRRLRAFAPSS